MVSGKERLNEVQDKYPSPNVEHTWVVVCIVNAFKCLSLRGGDDRWKDTSRRDHDARTGRPRDDGDSVTTRRYGRHVALRHRDAVELDEGVLGRLNVIPCLGQGLDLEGVRMNYKNEYEGYSLAGLSGVHRLVLRRIVEEQPC